MKRKYRILAIEESEYKEIIRRLEDIFEVNSDEYTPEQLEAVNTFWNYVSQEKSIGTPIDAVRFDYQRLMLPYDVGAELPKHSEELEVIDAISNFMDSMSDAFWPHVTDTLKEGEPYTEQLKKLIDND